MLGSSIDTARQSIAAFNAISPVGAPIAAERQGTYRGEAVRTTAEYSKISLAAKGVSVQSALKNNLATLAQRSVAQGQATDPEASARITDLREKLPDMPGPRHFGQLIAAFNVIRQDVAAQETIPEAATEEIAAELGSKFAAEEIAAEGVDSAEAESETRAEDGARENETNLSGLGGAVGKLQISRQARNDGGLFGGDGGESHPAEDIFRALEAFDTDPTHQFAALENLRGYFKSAGAEFQLVLDQAMAVFERNTDLARAVRAGYAAAEIAHRSAAKLGTDPRKVRDAYRAMLREQPNIGTLFDALAEQFGMTGNFEQVVETFLVAAGRDLANTGPSTDELFLHALTTELGKLKKMRTVFESGKELIARTDRIFSPAERGKVDPIQLTSRMLNFCAKRGTVSLTDARALLGPVETASLQHQVVFANGLVGLHADIPDEIMPSERALLQQKTTLSTLLNQLVAAEESFHESGKAGA